MKQYLIYAIPVILIIFVLLYRGHTPKHLRTYLKYARKGSMLAQETLGIYYYRAGKKSRRNYKKALKWCLMAAKNGSTDVFSILGNMYYYGSGTKVNIKEALKWYLPAAENGSCLAQFQCGFIYRNGKGGVPKNNAEAFKWYSLAADQGDDKAQLQVALCYLDGEGTERNIDKAVEWLKKSKAQGNKPAADMLREIPLVFPGTKI